MRRLRHRVHDRRHRDDHLDRLDDPVRRERRRGNRHRRHRDDRYRPVGHDPKA